MFDELFLFNVISALAGLLLHVIKKCASEKMNPITYIFVNKGRSSAAIGAIVTSVVTMMATRPDASPVEFFAIGYMGDSLFNRTPTPTEIGTALANKVVKKAAKSEKVAEENKE